MRVRVDYAGRNRAVLKGITMNLTPLDPIKCKGGIKTRRLIASTSDLDRVQLLGLS